MENNTEFKTDKISEAITRIKAHPIHKSALYTYTLDLRDLVGSMIVYQDDRELFYGCTPSHAIQMMTPEFQRENTKWNTGMKRRFVEAVLAGALSPIKLYSLMRDGECFGKVYILDGLQRLTAMAEFCEDKITIFDGIRFSEINHRTVMRRCCVQVQVYTFNTHADACRHYIEINRGITHSSEDLAVAEEYLSNQREILLP